VNYRKHFFQLVLCCLFFAGSFTRVFADCNVASPPNWKDESRQLQVCVGEFSTKQELLNTSIKLECLHNSNSKLSFCNYTPESNPLSNISDDNIAVDKNGKFYTCILTPQLPRAMGTLRITFFNTNTKTTYCQINNIDSKPSDWGLKDTLHEGLAGQEASTEQHFTVLDPTNTCVQTAIGCIPFTANGFIEKVFPIFISFGGAIAFLLILFGGIQMMTSAGNPEKLAGGKELIVSAITGLLLIIFSIFILRVIGYDILHIPGFGK